MKPHRFQKPFGKDKPMDVKNYWRGIIIRFVVLVIVVGIMFWLWSMQGAN